MDKIHVEIVVGRNTGASNSNVSEIKKICSDYLSENQVKPGTRITNFGDTSILGIAGIQEIIVDECQCFNEETVNYQSNSIQWHIYSLNMLGAQAENFGDANGEYINVASDYILPCADLHTLWENLIYDGRIKDDLLDYAEAIMSFSQRGVNFNIISCNKVILLHGPPGTGKTSLCKALAQKLSIRMMKTYPKSLLIEVNSHNLFSKWFSESGKLVTKMFDHIRDVCEMSNTLVCVLIDEVESLAHARDQCMNGNEPSDAFKVVNAVLTQIDNLKRYPNVLVLSTSNLLRAIDVAFVDRADFKQYIGPPNVYAIKKIYKTCIDELIRAGIINFDENKSESVDSTEFEGDLANISKASLNLSGRMLRKLPLLACASNLRQQEISLKDFMIAMDTSITNEFVERGKLIHNNGKNEVTNGF